MVVEGQCLLITIHAIFLPAVLITSTLLLNSWVSKARSVIDGIHTEKVEHFLGINVCLWDELYKW